MRFRLNLLFVSFLLAIFVIVSPAVLAGPLVAVDPGHGGWDSGAVGASGLTEKSVNLDIGMRLKALLQGGGYRPLMTRETDMALGPDLVGDLGGRTAIANNAGADIFISIHNNSSASSGAGGSETYYYLSPYTGVYDPDSQQLAKYIQLEVVNQVKRYDRGAKTANFYVLRNTTMPAVLVEGLFLSNPTEEAMLANPAVRQSIALGIFLGIKDYYTAARTSAWTSSSTGSSLSAFTNKWDSGPGNWDWSASKLTAGDFNGDNKTDLAILYGYASTRQSRLWVMTSNGTGFNAPQIWWDSGPNNWDWAGSRIAAGDFNGDHRTDLSVLYGYATTRQSRAWVFTANATGNAFNAPQIWWDSGPNNWDWAGSKLTVGDYNGDTRADLNVFYGYTTTRQSRAWVFTANASGNAFNTPQVWWDSGPNNWDWSGSKPVSGDFDGNGRADLAIIYGYVTTRQTKAWVFTSGGNAFNAPNQWWDSGSNNWDWSGSNPVAGDFNGDSRADICILYGYGSSLTRSWNFQSNGSGFNAPLIWSDSGINGWEWSRTQLVSGDFNGDGRYDLGGIYNHGRAASIP